MIKSKKILISLSIVSPILIGTSIAITSCSKTYEFVTPKPINLNSEVLTKINSKLAVVTSQLESMTNFENLFNFQTELLEYFQSNEFNFGEDLESVNIDLKPHYNNSQFEYKFKYKLNFKKSASIQYTPYLNNSNLYFFNNVLSSQEVILNNAILNNQTNKKITLWFTNSQSITTNSYLNLVLNNTTSFDIQYNDLKNNITETLKFDNSILNIDEIDVYIDNVINITTGTKWLSIDPSSIIENASEKNISINIKYNKNNNSSLQATESFSFQNINFNVSAIQI